MSQTAVDDRYFQTERVWKILLRIAPPVMLAQLIQGPSIILWTATLWGSTPTAA